MVDDDVIEHQERIRKFQNRSLLSIVRDWPTNVVPSYLTTYHRYKPEYRKLLAKLDIITDTFARVSTNQLSENISLPLTFIDMPQSVNAEQKVGKNRSTLNVKEAEIVCNVAKEALDNSQGKSILILTAYFAQHKAIKNKLIEKGLANQIELLHVNRSSSREKDIIIISLTRNNLTNTIGHMAENKITMMLKRAREGIIVVGNSNTFIIDKSKGERKLVKRLKEEAEKLQAYQNRFGGDNV